MTDKLKELAEQARAAHADPLLRAHALAIAIETAVELERTVYREDTQALLEAIEEAIRQREAAK